MYDDLNFNVEVVCQYFVDFAPNIAIAVFVLPAVLLTLVNYFVLDLGTESYYLPTLIWYVVIISAFSRISNSLEKCK